MAARVLWEYEVVGSSPAILTLRLTFFNVSLFHFKTMLANGYYTVLVDRLPTLDVYPSKSSKMAISMVNSRISSTVKVYNNRFDFYDIEDGEAIWPLELYPEYNYVQDDLDYIGQGILTPLS